MEKMKMQSENLVDENVDKIAKLFPNCVTEGKDENGKVFKAIDFDLLKQELSKVVVDGTDERYTLNWAGKKQAILTANSPINATLRPCREESVDFDNTKNLYIEGDNLDVLKLLRETYLNKIKMIYIDPPYNTGNDFVYNDDFASSSDEYLQNSKSYDEDGNRMVQNLESNGRFHSDWLSMMYPRLKLARDLLTDDGVIFISIDDNEQENLKKVCNEIFGESNFISQLIWRKKTGASDAVGFSVISEYILVYVKNISYVQTTFTKDLNAHDVNRYKLSDEYEERRGKYYIDNLDRGGIHYSDSLNYPITCPDGTITYPNGRKTFTQEGWTWTWGKEKLEWGLKNGFIEFRKSSTKDSGWAVCYKNYLNVNNKDELVARSAPHKNMIMDILNTSATLEIQKLFGNKVFQYTKPSELLKLIISFVNTRNGLILDFFSGSATTAHAVMALNAEDGGEAEVHHGAVAGAVRQEERGGESGVHDHLRDWQGADSAVGGEDPAGASGGEGAGCGLPRAEAGRQQHEGRLLRAGGLRPKHTREVGIEHQGGSERPGSALWVPVGVGAAAWVALHGGADRRVRRPCLQRRRPDRVLRGEDPGERRHGDCPAQAVAGRLPGQRLRGQPIQDQRLRDFQALHARGRGRHLQACPRALRGGDA